jgi:hypothetical protein
VGFLHPIEGLMLSVLHLDPVLRLAGLIGPVAMFRDKALKPELAGFAKQVRADLSLLKRADENPLRPACQEPFEVGFPHRQWKPAQIIAFHCQYVEGAELHFVVVPAGMERIEIGDPVNARMTASPSTTNCFWRFFRAASTIQGKRFVQS